MAKQSGIHQLRGKVGEHSYYRQTGVTAGLMRSINQGMSSRVKNSPEFANTRRNNAEFAGAANIAALLGTMVNPKYRPMILPFSQSNMSKKILEIAKVTPHAWGQRVVSPDDTASLAEILTSQSKLAMKDVVTLFASEIVDNSLSVEIGWNADQANLMKSLGIDGVAAGVAVYNLATGKYDAVAASIRKSYRTLVASDSATQDIAEGDSDNLSFNLTVPEFDFDAKGWNGHQLLVAVFLPYRLVNDIQYTLQEQCRFQAIALERAE